MTSLLLSAIAALTRFSTSDLLRKVDQAPEAQAQFLRNLLQTQQHTVLGQQHRLASIESVEQFRQQVPIWSYSHYEPYLERIAAGEPNVLTPDPVIYLNLTSGSTGKQKLVPVTRRSRQMLQRASRASIGFACAAAQRQGRPLGRMLLTSSVQLLGRTSGGIDYGPVSVGDLRMGNALNRQIFAHPFAALQPADSLARHYVCLLFALRSPNLGIIGANFPVLALRLCDYLETYGESLIDDLKVGAIADWIKLEPHLRQQLERQLNPNPQRAAVLQSILRSEGRLTPHLAWPELAFLITARGGTSDFYFQRFPEYFGDTPIFGGVYASAEATFGVYDDFNSDSTILAIDSGFFEFIPQSEWEREHPQTLLAHEVSPGERYRILVTNYNGFYRYDIGDVVEVVGFRGQAPLITFRHRRGGLLSSTTEKTTEFHVIQTMQRLQQDFCLQLENFCITLSDTGIPPNYLVNIELPVGQTLDDLQGFLKAFDHTLQEIHTSYAIKRRDQVPPPRLRLLAPGSCATVRQQMIQRGIPESQLKFPHISDDRQLLAGLEVLCEVRLEDDVA